MRIACFGGIYSNYLALEEALHDARRRGVDGIFCLGDFGAFGPYPNRAIDLLRAHDVICIQGNYDNSIAEGLDDCQCGYTDPRDNHFAQISYTYTLSETSTTHRQWMRQLPRHRRLDLGDAAAYLCHGSPRRLNEFLWESTTSTQFLEYLCDEFETDLILCTHTGLKWRRALSNGRCAINVGVLGRPENDGRTCVWYTIVEKQAGRAASCEFIPVEYNHRRLAAEMEAESLPEEFTETILSGWWTTCLEVLPAKERRRGKY